MSASENKKNLRGVTLYFYVTVLCVLIFLVYDPFSHGVRSRYMTFLFLWPLIFGLLPALLLRVIPGLPAQGPMSANLYHPGVAAVTVSSLLRGILEIAGTASVYQRLLMPAGAALMAAGAAAYILKK